VTVMLPQSPSPHRHRHHPVRPITRLPFRDPNTDTLRRMSQALDDLAGVKTLEQLVDRVPAALCRVGFDRAMISRVAESRWVVERFHSEIDPAGAALITEAAQSEPLHLGPAVLELEMVRRRVALLVLDVHKEPRVHPQLAEMTGSSSYVAAPIVPHGDVVGFLHADRVDGLPMTEFDREVLTLFAHHLSALVRTLWLDDSFNRLRTTVDHLRESLGGMIDGCVQGDVGLARAHEPVRATGGGAGQQLAETMLVGVPGVDALLSTREREVLRLMALGETNTKIASRLVISEGTVKSHVRHILRKLNAANRAEAVCRWLQKPA
jgi:DNA-binding CsgD family transcriptional regulator